MAGWQKRFEKLGLHPQASQRAEYLTCEVTGPQSRRLHGYLLSAPEALFQKCLRTIHTCASPRP